MNKKIFLATDHAGFEHKQEVKNILEKEFSKNFEIIDCGSFEYKASDDYPDFIKKAAQKVSENPKENIAIIFGGSGQGEAMVANRFENVRATVFYGGSFEILELSKKHNNANILSIGARFTKKEGLKKNYFYLNRGGIFKRRKTQQKNKKVLKIKTLKFMRVFIFKI